jgi:hypothetical protein
LYHALCFCQLWAEQALQVPQTLIGPAPHARRVSFLHVDCCVACLHRSNIRFLLLCHYARVIVSSMQSCNTTGTADIASTLWLIACISLCRLIVLDCLCVQRSQISPVGGSIDRTARCQQLHTVAFLASPMFCKTSYTQLQLPAGCVCCKHCCMLSLCVLHACMPVCMRSKSSLSRGSCLSTCSQCEVLQDSEPAYHRTCGPVMPSASGCSNMLPCTQCLQVEHSKHHHLNATHFALLLAV